MSNTHAMLRKMGVVNLERKVCLHKSDTDTLFSLQMKLFLPPNKYTQINTIFSKPNVGNDLGNLHATICKFLLFFKLKVAEVFVFGSPDIDCFNQIIRTISYTYNIIVAVNILRY